MRDLRLIGVHDDGEHLVVVDDAGEQFRLRIDEPLRAAARRDRPRLGQLQIEIDNDVRPREVQAMIRAGATADEVAARTGWSLERIARFEGPVIAEREHIAGRAQAVRLRGTNAAGGSETLVQRAGVRLADRGVEAADVEWDAARDAEGQWTVSASFSAGGRPRVATWWFDVGGMSVVAKNDEARWLSESDGPAGPLPQHVHRPTAVFDVEADEPRPGRRAPRADTDELIASMREHSGARSRRRGRRRTKAATEQALPLEDAEITPTADPEGAEEREAVTSPAEPTSATEGARPAAGPGLPPAARGTHPKDEAPADEPGDGAPAAAEEAGSPETAAEQDSTDGPVQGPGRPGDDLPGDPEDGAPEDAGSTDEDSADAVVPDEDASDQDASHTQAETTAEATGTTSGTPKPAAPKKKGRPSVPSWDDVMFGSKRS